MAEITRILAGNICRQFFFVINTPESVAWFEISRECCLVRNFN